MLTALTITSSPAFADLSRAARLARQAADPAPTLVPAHVPDELLVRFKSTQGRRAADLLTRERATVLRRFSSVSDLQRVRLPAGASVADAARRWAADPSVLYAEPNYLYRPLAVPNDPRLGDLWGLRNTGQQGGVADADIDAPEAWDLTTGSSGVVVAVIDTGIDYTHPDLAPNMYRNEVECTPNGVDDDTNGWIDDCHGIDTADDDGDPRSVADVHGSHVAGTIGARGNNGLGVTGVTWDVRIIACKFIQEGFGSNADAIQCLDYLALMKDRGVNVVASNNSWGGDPYSQALLDAIDAQGARGILFVAAAGNSGTDASGVFPASYYLPNILTVAATTRTDALAGFSNFGRTTTHLGAPGTEILSTTPGGTYQAFEGTSMAAPHVTGALALLKAQDGGRDWRALRNLVLAGGDPVPALATTTATGRRLNVHGALACSGTTVSARLRPMRDVVSIGPGQALPLAAIHVDCASPAGSVPVGVEPGGATFDLLDDGAGFDQVAGDGVYSGTWTPVASGAYTLAIAGTTVNVDVDPDFLMSPAAGAGHHFGTALAGDGALLLVGEPGNDTGATDAGAAYLVDTATGATLRTFANPDPDSQDQFGAAVALSGGYALVGAPYDDVLGGEPGAAYLFDAATGALLHTLHAPVLSDHGWFGFAVSFVDGQPAVGTPGDDGAATDAGAVHLFDRDTGALVHTFHNPAPAAGDGFGWSLATLGTTLAVGAPREAPAGFPAFRYGFVHLFDGAAGSPTLGALQRTIFPVAPAVGTIGSFGETLATNGGDLLIGDPNALLPEIFSPHLAAAGVVHVVDGSAGTLRRTLVSPFRRPLARFGNAMAAAGGRLFVGAPADDVLGTATGIVYVYEASTGAPLRALTGPAPGAGYAYGFALTPAGSGVFAGAPQDGVLGDSAGAVYRAILPPAVDRARCYKAKNASGSAKLPKLTVTLADALATTTSVVGGPLVACEPAAPEGAPLAAPDAHLTCHKLKDTGTALAATALAALGPLGVDYLTVRKAYALCAASGWNGDPVPAGLDAYKCYRATATKGWPRFVETRVGLTDVHGTRYADVKKPLAVCAPVGIDGSPVTNPETFLTCYQAKDHAGQAPVPDATVTVASPLGPETLTTRALGMLCVPSQRLAP